MENNVPFQFHFFSHEVERKWNGKGMEKKDGDQLELNFNGMEWHWNRKFSSKMIKARQNGIGMEMEKKILNKNIQCKTEWKGNGNGMEKKSKNKMEFKFDRMEWKWKGNGMENKDQQSY